MPGEYGAHQGRNADVVEASGVQRGFGGGRRPIGGGNLCEPGCRALFEPIGEKRGSLRVNTQVRGGIRATFPRASIRGLPIRRREKFPHRGGRRRPTPRVEYVALHEPIPPRFRRCSRAEADR